MSERIDLKEADRRVFATSFDDGMVDIFISSVGLMLVIGPLLSVYLGDFWSSAIFLPFWGVIYLVIRWVRKNVIKPRSGVVKYGPMRRKKMTIFTGIMLALNVIFLILGMYAFFSFIPGSSGWAQLNAAGQFQPGGLLFSGDALLCLRLDAVRGILPG